MHDGRHDSPEMPVHFAVAEEHTMVTEPRLLSWELQGRILGRNSLASDTPGLLLRLYTWASARQKSASGGLEIRISTASNRSASGRGHPHSATRPAGAIRILRPEKRVAPTCQLAFCGWPLVPLGDSQRRGCGSRWAWPGGIYTEMVRGTRPRSSY